MKKILKYNKYIFSIIFILCCNLYMCSCSQNNKIKYFSENLGSLEEDSSVYNENENSSTNYVDYNSLETEKEFIFVYIYGEVLKPDVYKLEDGLRLIDLVELAGGFTNEANTTYHNLAAKLNDEQKIYIPRIDEDIEELTNKGVLYLDIINNSDKININTASEQELLSLRGIGKSKAKQIIEYRNNNGKFSSIEDIMNIKGIKNSAFEKIKDKICVK